MTAVLDEKVAPFQFSGDWTPIIEESLKDILLNTWQEWGFEEIDEEFIIFVLDMIKKRDSMKDVADEMNGVGLDESQTKLIIERFVEALLPYSKASEVEKPPVIPESAKDPSADRLLAPLKTSRESNPKDNSKDNESKSINPNSINRLLNSALSSARNNDNNNTNNNLQQQRKGKRNIHNTIEDDINNNNNNGGGRKSGLNRNNINDNNNNNTSSSNTRNIKQKLENQNSNKSNNQNNFPPYPPTAPYPDPSMMGYAGPPGMMSGPPPTDPVQYFEHMNQVAIKSGFKNAQEMLAMFHGNVAPPQYPPHPHGPPPPHTPYPGPGMNYQYPPPNPYEQPPYQPPYHQQPPRPHQAGRFHSGRSNTYVRDGLGRGRGAADRAHQEEGKKESTTKPSAPAPKPAIAITEATKTEVIPATTLVPDGNDQHEQSENKDESATDQSQSTWGHSGGRGRGGRFAAGRGAPRAAGGRFGGRVAPAPAATAVFFNPFAQNNNTSLQALASATTAPITSAPFVGDGRGGRGASAGRVVGNKVWVRPGTEETATPQQS